MKICIADMGVAQALAPLAKWVPVQLRGYSVSAEGVFVRAQGDYEAVAATLEDAVSVKAYFALFEGAWCDHESDFQLYVSETNEAAPLSETTRQVERCVARDVAVISAAPTQANTPIDRAGLVMRARSRLRAESNAVPAAVRSSMGVSDVSIERRALDYARYFDVEDIALRHRKFDGGQSDVIHRAVYRAADAVTVLPYDPILDQVVVIEQFRAGAFVRGDTRPWTLEPVAGRCDGDEPVEDVARRELIEEANLTPISLESIGNYYPSPGAMSEYLYSFVAIVDLRDAATGVFGLETENEDIRTHFLDFEAAMDLVHSGEADNGPLLLSLYWLAAHRARLRAATSAA